MKKILKKLRDKWNNSESFIFWSVLLCMIFLLIIYSFVTGTDFSFKKAEQVPPATTATTELTKVEELELLYHKNSNDIVNEINKYITNNEVMEDDYSDDAVTIRIISQYVNDYLTNTSEYSDYRFDLEVDIFVDLFKSDLLKISRFKNLIERRETLLTIIESFNEQ